jgi:hypothetical protein
MGELKSPPIRFECAQDVVQGGVLLALPALLAQGLLRHTAESYSLPNGFYGIETIFLLLALLAPARMPSIEPIRAGRSRPHRKNLSRRTRHDKSHPRSCHPRTVAKLSRIFRKLLS